MFGQRIELVFGGPLQDACEYYDMDYDHEFRFCEALTMTETRPRGKQIILIWFRDDKPKPGVIAHEALHATCSSLARCGLQMTDSSEETYAYYLDWLVEKIHKELS
jgi:hypothetical protein